MTIQNCRHNGPAIERIAFLLFALMAVAPITPARAQEGTMDAKRAYGYLMKVCRIGPRMSGSAGMTTQQELVFDHFTKLGAQVRFQPFEAPHPLTGAPTRLANIIVSWHPEAKVRILLACHYDTRPYPDRDRYNPRGKFVGANDGASGVALFMEMAHHMPGLTSAYGIDFVFFDGEEFVFSDRDQYFLGSEYFAKGYRDRPPEHRYAYGVLVDMIADRHLTLYQEKNSMRFAPELTRSVWATARKLRVREFVASVRHEVNDDHIPLNTLAKIPTCDLIDFDYPYWHTTRDLPTACSGASIQKVGRVLLQWLRDAPLLSNPSPAIDGRVQPPSTLSNGNLKP